MKRTREVFGWDEAGNPAPVDRNAVMQLLQDVEAVGEFVGGVFVLAPVRREVEPGQFEVIGWSCEWRSVAPAARVQRPGPAEKLVERCGGCGHSLSAHSPHRDHPDDPFPCDTDGCSCADFAPREDELDAAPE